MTTCAGCGHATGPSDRFCPRCGLPIGAVDGLEDLPPVSDSPQWSDTVDDRERRVRRNPAGRLRRRAVASSILVVAAAAAITWMAVRSPTTPVFGLTDELAGPPTTSAEDSSAAGDRPAITGLAAGREERTDGAVVVDPGRLDPALADYRLLAARDSEFIAIDLATGEATTHRTTGRLIGFFGDELIVFDPATGVMALPVADVEAEPEPIFAVSSDRPSVSSAVVDEDGILQLTTTDTSAETPLSIMTRIDLASGFEVSAEVPSFGSMGLVEVPGGGLFSLDEAGFRRLTEASVELYGSTYVLVEQCEDPQQCRRFWLQRSTGVRITRPTPAFRSGYVLGRGGRVAVGTGLDHTRFFDVRLARDVPIDDAFHETGGPWFVVEDLTDDDRFLVAVVGAAGNDILIHDLDDRTDTRFELGRSSPLSRVLFVPKTGRR